SEAKSFHDVQHCVPRRRPACETTRPQSRRRAPKRAFAVAGRIASEKCAERRWCDYRGLRKGAAVPPPRLVAAGRLTLEKHEMGHVRRGDALDELEATHVVHTGARRARASHGVPGGLE